jgi:hypothetical protein
MITHFPHTATTSALDHGPFKEALRRFLRIFAIDEAFGKDRGDSQEIPNFGVFHEVIER